MLTPSHGLIAWIVGRRLFRSRPEMIKFLVLGSVFADVAMDICGLFWFLTGYRHPWDIYLDISVPTSSVLYPTRILHSFFTSLAVYITLSIFKDSAATDRARVVFWGWTPFHLFIDLLTHQQYAHEHFWPVSSVAFHSWISDENLYFFIFDSCLSVMAITLVLLWLVKSLKKILAKT